MANPIGDDDWADLAEELGIEQKPKPQPAAAAEVAVEPPPFPEIPWPEDPTAGLVLGNTQEPESELPDAVEPLDEADTLIEPGLSGEAIAGDSNEDGTDKGRKRRRRRRRGRKPEGEGESGTADEAVPPEFEGAEDAGTTSDLDEPEPAVMSMVDAIRELSANWNVPSWQEIVSGLYRPTGGGDRERSRSR